MDIRCVRGEHRWCLGEHGRRGRLERLGRRGRDRPLGPQRRGEILATGEPLIGIDRQRPAHRTVQIGEFPVCFGQPGNRPAQPAADHHGRIRVGIRRGSGEEVKRRRRQRVLIRPPVDGTVHELFGRGVADGTHRHVGGGQPGHIVELPRDSEVREQDSPLIALRRGEQDVRRLDVAVQQTTAVRVVQRVGHRTDDLHRLVAGHPVRKAFPQHLSRVGTIDEVHRDPQLTVVLAPVVHAHDVGVPQGGRGIGLALEAQAVVPIFRQRPGQDLERIVAGQPRVPNQVHLAHAPGPEQPDHREAREGGSTLQRHVADRTESRPASAARTAGPPRRRDPGRCRRSR